MQKDMLLAKNFLILLFNTPQSEALTLAENIRQKIEQNTVKLTNQKLINFTISIGIHTIADNKTQNKPWPKLMTRYKKPKGTVAIKWLLNKHK